MGYKHLFNTGVLSAPKDKSGKKHPILSLSSIEVINLMKSFVSRSFATEKFSWQWYYWVLTDEGIAYLRTYLQDTMELPDSAVPATRQQIRPQNRGMEMGMGAMGRGIGRGLVQT